MTPRVKPPHTLLSVLHWLWYCRATPLSALANLTLLLGKNTLPFPAFGNLNFVSPPHRRAYWYTSIPKSYPNIRFPHQQDFFPIRSVTKSSTARFSHENLVEKFKIFVQDFVPIRTALRDGSRSSDCAPDDFFQGIFFPLQPQNFLATFPRKERPKCVAVDDGGRFFAYHFFHQPRVENRYARNKSERILDLLSIPQSGGIIGRKYKTSSFTRGTNFFFCFLSSPSWSWIDRYPRCSIQILCFILLCLQ